MGGFRARATGIETEPDDRRQTDPAEISNDTKQAGIRLAGHYQ